MKKLGKVFVCLVAALSLSNVAFAKVGEVLPISTLKVQDINTLIVNGDKVDLGDLKIHNEGKHVMVPLRVLCDALGFDLTWDEQGKNILLDNGDVKTTLTIGKDSYFKSSSQALGLTRPVELGIAPTIINNSTYVPVELFEVLYGNDDMVQIKEDTLSITTKEDVQLPSPLKEMSTVEEAEAVLGFDAKMPTVLPQNYDLKSIHVISDTVMQLIYKDADAQMVMRVAKGNADISGDYTLYEDEKEIEVNGNKITVKGNNNEINHMTWYDGEKTYSISAQEGLTMADTEQLIENLM